MIARLRKAIREGRYRVSAHALEEMADDDLLSTDVEQIVLSGEIIKKQTRDLRGPRYLVQGYTTEGRGGCVVSRFAEDGALLIITAYVLED